MNINAFIAEIEKHNFSSHELNQLHAAVTDACNYAWKKESRQAAANFQIGDKVVFTSNKKSGSIVYTGKIVKFNARNVSVQTTTTVWRVPANMLTKASE